MPRDTLGVMNPSALGLFGPDSVTWRVHADPTMGMAGLRALFLQSLHPDAVTAVHRYSGFKTDPWGRLMRTAEYVGTITYGTAEEAHRSAARVRAVHERLPGVAEPELLLWVHCCEVDSFLSTVRRAGLRLSAAEADRYVAEQVEAGRLIGVDDAPRTLAELEAYFDDVRPRLAVTREAYDTARFLMLPPMPRLLQIATPVIPAWVGVAALCFALLPRWARRMYRLPGLPTTDFGATLAVRAIRTALMAVPEPVRDGPYLTQAKTRLDAELSRAVSP